jgi:hypothetical protein
MRIEVLETHKQRRHTLTVSDRTGQAWNVAIAVGSGRDAVRERRDSVRERPVADVEQQVADVEKQMDSGFNFLTAAQADLLNEILARRSSTLLA